jgi:biotin carboxyl carrier protein
MEELKGNIILDDTVYKTNLTKKFSLRKPYRAGTHKEVRAFIPGSIRDVLVKQGDIVKQGDMMLILEAMKMKNRIFSPINGKIKTVNVKIGDVVPKNELLVEFE